MAAIVGVQLLVGAALVDTAAAATCKATALKLANKNLNPIVKVTLKYQQNSKTGSIVVLDSTKDGLAVSTGENVTIDLAQFSKDFGEGAEVWLKFVSGDGTADCRTSRTTLHYEAGGATMKFATPGKFSLGCKSVSTCVSE